MSFLEGRLKVAAVGSLIFCIKEGNEMKMREKRWWWILPALIASIGFYGHVVAGSLEPTAPPGTTMHTMEEIYQKLQQLTGGGVQVTCGSVQATGQTSSFAAGDDGAFQKGSKADPRFTDNGNGTVTDNLTKLIWMKDANYLGGTRTWANAIAAANSLANGTGGLTDGSVAGDWRLPNVRELQSLVDYSRLAPALPGGHPFTNVQPNLYWTSTSNCVVTTPTAWITNFNGGHADDRYKTESWWVWCVRGGS